MPCRDYMDDHPHIYYGEQLFNKDLEIERLNKKLSFAESSLCAVLRAIENAGLDVFSSNSTGRSAWRTVIIDWKDAGVSSKELENWFVEHKRADAIVREKVKKEKEARLLKEAKAKELKQKKEAALSKLTIEERKILGIGK